jgi:hypothetical protein
VEWNSKEPSLLIELAYATRRTESIHAAHAILTRAAGLHPNDRRQVQIDGTGRSGFGAFMGIVGDGLAMTIIEIQKLRFSLASLFSILRLPASTELTACRWSRY